MAKNILLSGFINFLLHYYSVIWLQFNIFSI